MALQIGDKAPEILGTDQNGQEIKLADYKGKKLILYFYPKDNTSGCTAEACSFRDYKDTLVSEGYEILGVSADSEKSHKNFIEKHGLNFSLIADTNKSLSEAFGTWGEKSMYGRKYMGMFRTTFIIDKNGIIEKIFQPKEIKTKIHAEQILALKK